jgi:IS30 family transposase
MGKHHKQLTAEERAAIMMMKVNNCAPLQISLTLRRAPSTITRELTRFAAWPDRPAQTVDFHAVLTPRRGR